MIATVMISTSERRPAPSSFATEHERWAAVLRRDPAADSVFCFSAVVCGAAASPGERSVPSHLGGCGAGRISSMQAVPAE